jgi:hypothetical protein
MAFHNLVRVSEFEVKDWFLKKVPELTAYQKEKLDSEFFRMSPFSWYKKAPREKVSFLWRLSIVIYPIYLLVLLIGIPFTFIVRGKWGYSQKMYENFHCAWMRKIGMG